MWIYLDNFNMSAIWLRKIKTLFHALDFGKKGVITLDDWEQMPRKYAEKEKASSELRDKSIKAFRDVSFLDANEIQV